MYMAKTGAAPLTMALFALAGCGGGSGSADGGGSSVVLAVHYNAAPADVCPNGGAQLDTGIDVNKNGLLDTAEVRATQYVCNGADGSGLTTLVAITDEGGSCANGGKKISAGLDANRNTVLDEGEATSIGYLCNGDTGTNGQDGISSLIALTAEPAGAHCAAGGSKVEMGADDNGSGSLDEAEVDSVSYACAAPQSGGVVAWVQASTDVQARPNTGYMTDGASQVTVTLPSAPAIGDVVRVSGKGGAGWRVAVNGGQSIKTPEGLSSGVTWVAREAERNWQAVASSGDGASLVAAVSGGEIYTSSDFGLSWSAHETARNWSAVASSADGSRLIAAENGGYLYTSSDFGASWTPREATRNWTSVASSANGTRLIAAEENGDLYTSIDAGINWTPHGMSGRWTAVASSGDGQTLVATRTANPPDLSAGAVFVSTDSGTNWDTAMSGGLWSCAAVAAQAGNWLAAETRLYGILGGRLMAGGGVQSLVNDWSGVAASADGSKLVAAITGGQLYTSDDGGVNWNARESSRAWRAVASSADGNQVIAAELGGRLYVSGHASAIAGDAFEAVELQYIGKNVFIILSHSGSLQVQ